MNTTTVFFAPNTLSGLSNFGLLLLLRFARI
jgi:hypothetical protein